MLKKIILIISIVFFMISGTGFASQKIDINKAGKTELSQLTGIGEKYAERIIEYRNKNGNFTKIEDLLQVKGIGEKTLMKNKDKLTVDSQSSAKIKKKMQ